MSVIFSINVDGVDTFYNDFKFTQKLTVDDDIIYKGVVLGTGDYSFVTSDYKNILDQITVSSPVDLNDLETRIIDLENGGVGGSANSIPSVFDIGDWPANVSIIELGYLDGLDSNIQTQFDNLANVAFSGSYDDLSDKPNIPTISDEEYNVSTWDGNQDAPTKNAIRDQFVAFDAQKEDINHTHSASEVTSGTFADGRISESSVKQHEASLEITESQISDLGDYITSAEAPVQSVAGEVGTISAADLRTALNVEDGADVTDTNNVRSAGAVMDDEVENLAAVKSFDPADYATDEQGALADSAVQPGDYGLEDPIDETSDWDNLTLPGFYRVTAGAVNGPGGLFNWAAQVHESFNTNNLVVKAFRVGATHAEFRRSRSGGIWSDWFEVQNAPSEGPFENGDKDELDRLSSGAYTSYAAAEAANIPAPVQKIAFITNGWLSEMVRDASGTALTTNDGATWSPAGWATPYAFGATGDGSTDDSPAIITMFTWVMEGTGNWRQIHFPAGRFCMEERFATTYQDATPSENRGLYVTGERASTQIIVKNRHGFFSWIMAAQLHIRAVFDGFHVRMENPGSNGIIFELVQPTGGVSKQREVEFRNINIYPATLKDNYAVSFIRARGMYWPHVIDCEFANVFPSVTFREQFKGRTALDFNETYGPEYHSSKCWGCWYGFTMRDSAVQAGEGGILKGSVINAWYPVHVKTESSEPAFDVNAMHLNAGGRCVWIDKRRIVRIRDSVLYMQDGPVGATPITNLVRDSHDQSGTGWGGTTTVTSADNIDIFEDVQEVEDTSGANELRAQGISGGVVAGADYVASLLVAEGTAEANQFNLYGTDYSIGVKITWVDGVPEPENVYPDDTTDFGVIDMGDGMWLVYFSGNTSTSTDATIRFWPTGFVGGGAATGSVKVESVQVQTGTFPTPHIRTGATAVTQRPTDVYLDEVDFSEVNDTTFWFGDSNDTDDRVNIHATGNCTKLEFSRNKHRATVETGYLLESGIDRVMIDSPVFESGVDRPIENQGVTRLQVKHSFGFELHWGLSSAQSISDNTLTLINWNNEIDDLDNLGTPGGTIVVPSYRGISSARIEIKGVWANNNTGARQFRITKNNGDPIDAVEETYEAEGIAENRIIGYMDVTAGDVIRVLCYQNSGGSLDLSAATTVKVTYL